MADLVDDPHRQASQVEGDRGAQPPMSLTEGIRDRLVRLAYRFVWDRDAAEDAVQDALATAEQRAGELRDRGRWWPWVVQILLTRSRQQGRRRRLVARHMPRLAVERGGDALEAEGSLGLERREAGEALRAALGRLPTRQREVIVLRHLQQMTFEQIGEVLGISAATARVHAMSGREALRDLLVQQEPGVLRRPE